MHQDYPFFAPGQKAQQAIRVQLAALLACLESGVEYPPDEVAPFRLPEEDDKTTTHQFAWVAPSGRLAKDVDEVVASISRAILRRDIQPLLLVVSLEDDIDPVNTWISAPAFELWCSQRTMEIVGSELWNRFRDEAYYIEEAAMRGAAIELESLEATQLRQHYEPQRLAEQDWYGSLSPDVQDQVSKYLQNGTVGALRKLGYPDAGPGSVGEQASMTTEGPLMGGRERGNLYKVIGALLQLHLDRGRHGEQGAIIKTIVERWPIPGLSPRHLDGVFAEAKRRISDPAARVR